MNAEALAAASGATSISSSVPVLTALAGGSCAGEGRNSFAKSSRTFTPIFLVAEPNKTGKTFMRAMPRSRPF